jgi:enoyl-CoA hydratase/carnithine racemase
MSAGVGAQVRRETGGIAEVVLTRPEALNALDTATLTLLADLLTGLAADPRARVVVLSATGERAFCVGADLKERAAMTDEQVMAQRPVFRTAFGALLGLPQPVIAAVHGFALGGGCELALSCDVIVADRTAVFGLPEVTVGLVPGCGGTQLAARRIGPGRAADLILSGRKVDAAEAAAIGLADRVVEAGAAREQAIELARQMAANSPVAVRAAKRALRNGAGLGLAAALDVEDAAWRTAAGSADRREGIAAFAQKRRPVWPSAGQDDDQAGPDRSASTGRQAGWPEQNAVAQPDGPAQPDQGRSAAGV